MSPQSSLSIRPVESRRDLKTFVYFPWTLYKGDPYWVPQLPSSEMHHLDRARSASWQHMEGEFFIAWRDDRPVGTISAHINHRHNEFQGEHIGFFGAFHAYNDQEVATALLDTAADWVRTRGYDALRGPMTFSTNDLTGVLIEGFDDVPGVMMPYNYPYYQALIENTPGFAKVMDLLSFHFTLDGTEHSEKFQRFLAVVDKNNARRGITVRQINAKNLDADLSILREIYNRAWEKNWGFVPFSDAELDELVAELGMYIDPRTAFFAQVHGEPVAFLLALPDMNQPQHPAYPRPRLPALVNKLRVLWHWKIRSKITRYRVMLLGVQEGYRGIGVETAMFSELFARVREIAPAIGLTHADGGWVLETNTAMIQLCEVHGARAYKRYRIYERALK